MSIRSVRKAITEALRPVPGSSGPGAITKKEAQAIAAEARRGGVTAGEAHVVSELIHDHFSSYRLLRGARKALEEVATPTAKPVSPADIAAARALRGAIRAHLASAMVSPTPLDKQPIFDSSAGRYRTRAGNYLLNVQLSEPPPRGSADLPSQFALVDAKTNTYFSVTQGGLTGMRFVDGPLALPESARFGKRGKSLSLEQLAALELYA